MRNLLICLTFDGSCYHGWQVQPNGITVQQAMGDAVERITGNRGRITGCSRTDAGVHADMFFCCLYTESGLPCDRLQGALNAVLPYSIAVNSCLEVPLDFHPRYDCKYKQYRYVIWDSHVRNPFLKNYAYHSNRVLDAQMLDSQAKDFIGTYDFSAFCAAHASTVDNVRTIYSSDVRRDGNTVTFTVSGNGFLYNMVRIMTGTLLEIDCGKIEKNTIKDIIASKDRSKAGLTVPPCGLYLNKVVYERGVNNG